MAAERKVGKVRWFSAPTGRPAVNLSFSFRTPSTSSTGKWNNRGKGELLSQAQERVLLYGCEPLSISPLNQWIYCLFPDWSAKEPQEKGNRDPWLSYSWPRAHRLLPSSQEL